MNKWRVDVRQLFLSRILRFTAGWDYWGAYPALRQSYSICEQDHTIRSLMKTKLYSQTSLSSLKTFSSNTFAWCNQLTLTWQQCQEQGIGISIILWMRQAASWKQLHILRLSKSISVTETMENHQWGWDRNKCHNIFSTIRMGLILNFTPSSLRGPHSATDFHHMTTANIKHIKVCIETYG